MRDRIRTGILIFPMLIVMAMAGSQLWRALTVQRIGIFSRVSRGIRDIVWSEHPVEFVLLACFYLWIFAFCAYVLPRLLRLTLGNRPEDSHDRRRVLAASRDNNPSGFKPLWYGLAIVALIFGIYVAYGLATI